MAEINFALKFKFTFKFKRKYASQLIVNLKLKHFKINKQIKFELRIDQYNLKNS